MHCCSEWKFMWFEIMEDVSFISPTIIICIMKGMFFVFPVNLLTMLSRYDLINDIKVLRLCWTKCFIFGTYSVFLMWNYLCLMSWRGVVLASMTMLGWSRHTWEQRFRSSRVFVLVTQACVRYADRRQYIIYTRSIQLDGVGSQYMHRIDIY